MPKQFKLFSAGALK